MSFKYAPNLTNIKLPNKKTIRLWRIKKGEKKYCFDVSIKINVLKSRFVVGSQVATLKTKN